MAGCPFHSDTADTKGDAEGSRRERNDHDQDGLERRAFVKSALLIGGTSAVSSLGSVAGITTTASADDTGRVTAAARLNRQHHWNDYEALAASGNTPPPPNSIILLLDYSGAGEPTATHRRQVAGALEELERHFDWHRDGLLFTMAYSAAYFDRFDEDPPPGAAPDAQQEVVKTVEALTTDADTNDDVTPDTYDAVLVMASTNAANLLAAEAALWGDDAKMDGSFDPTFEGVFEQPDGWPARRVGFAGPEFQEREGRYEEEFLDDGQSVPDEAPLSMGHIAGFGESMPAEDLVTLTQGQRFPNPKIEAADVPTDLAYVGEVGERDPGVFAQGTLKHLSHLEIDLSSWYGEDGDDDEADGMAQRRHQMYSPYHDEEETNAKGGDKPGSGLTEKDAEDPNSVAPDDNRFPVRSAHGDDYAEQVPKTAAGEDHSAETVEPTAGHSQKTARARYDIDGDGNVDQPVLRRDWDAITPTGDDGADTAGYIFNVPMRFNESIYTLLDANYNIGFTSLDGRIDHDDVEADGIKQRNGIAPYMTALRRGNWVVPPITIRALPYPRAQQVPETNLSVTKVDNNYVVEISGVGGRRQRLDRDTVRFGTVENVNQAGGASPTDVMRGRGRIMFKFPAGETDLSQGKSAKLFGKKQGSRKPVVGTTRL